MKLWSVILVLQILVIETVLSYPQCTAADWSNSFDKTGLSQCGNGYQLITGFYKSKGVEDEDIKYLEYANCCTGTGVWERMRETMTTFADWRRDLDIGNSWASCPAGYFLQGMYRGAEKSRLHNIEYGQCSKPAEHPPFHGECVEFDIGECMKKPGWCKCPDDHYVVAIRRGGCDGLYCLDFFKCCKMVEGPEPLDGFLSAQNRVMDVTLLEMATLANYLGFAWAHGCRATRVGQGFQRDKFTWSASTVTLCSGDKNKERLQIAYEDWSFETTRITYGEPSITHLAPESVDGGEVHNNNDLTVVQQIWRTVEVIRSVSHIAERTHKFAFSSGASVSISSASATYTFSYEKETTRTDKNGRRDEKTFDVEAYYDIKPFSALRWSLRLFQTQSTVTYKAKIRIRFSATFKGFLRTGGLSQVGLNFHSYYRRHGDKPSFSYKFGDSRRPFYEALEEESYYSASPWLWMDLKLKYPKVKDLIKGLTNRCRFSLYLEGKFVDVQGMRSNVYFYDIPLQNKTKTTSQTRRSQPDSSNLNYKHIQVLTSPNPDVFEDKESIA